MLTKLNTQGLEKLAGNQISNLHRVVGGKQTLTCNNTGNNRGRGDLLDDVSSKESGLSGNTKYVGDMYWGDYQGELEIDSWS